MNFATFSYIGYSDCVENHWLIQAVTNNADWCEAVAASHNISTNRSDSAWLSEHPMPRFYPNIVTLRSDAVINKKIDALSTRLPVGWGIKDSYSVLALSGKGFVLAFEALWYCRVPNQDTINKNRPALRLQTVKTPSELNRWVTAWGDGNGIFNSSLLDNNAVELIYVEHDGNIVSGLATNQSSNSVGISNAFGLPDDILGCVSSVIKKHPMKAIVGYGSNAEVVALSKVGFKEIGGLRVWLRD